MSGKYLQRAVLLAGLASFAFAAPAHAVLVDISGATSDGPAFIIPVQEDENATIDELGFWFEFEAFSPSFLDELAIEVRHFDAAGNFTSSATLFGGAFGGDPNCGLPAEPGTAECDIFIDFPVTDVFTGDLWEVRFFEVFDDGSVTPDGRYGPGSIIAWGDDIGAISATKVPEPSTLAIFGLGLAGLGFFMTRRRRGA